jgi:hypothetical protein
MLSLGYKEEKNRFLAEDGTEFATLREIRNLVPPEGFESHTCCWNPTQMRFIPFEPKKNHYPVSKAMIAALVQAGAVSREGWLVNRDGNVLDPEGTVAYSLGLYNELPVLVKSRENLFIELPYQITSEALARLQEVRA